jgi:hypothetical protein
MSDNIHPSNNVLVRAGLVPALQEPDEVVPMLRRPPLSPSYIRKSTDDDSVDDVVLGNWRIRKIQIKG